MHMRMLIPCIPMGSPSGLREFHAKNGCGVRGDVCLRQVYDGLVITLEFENTGKFLMVARAAKNGSAKNATNGDVLVHGITRWAPGTTGNKHA